MIRKLLLIIGAAFLITNAHSQKVLPPDSTLNYDDLFSDLDDFLDSLSSPRNMFLVNIGISNRYFNYESERSFLLETVNKKTITPALGYFFKNGLGLNASVTIVDDGVHFNPYQVALTGSYDYLKNHRYSTGASFTRFFTKDSLPFYTTPLNESETESLDKSDNAIG